VIFRQKGRQKEKEQENLLSNFSTSSRFAEAYRTLRTNLYFSSIEKEIKSVVITSSVESEGKTTTATNLAYTIAQTDRKVLLIDCDLRRPHLTTLFNATKGMGVTTLISGVLGVHITQGNLKEFSVGDLVQLLKLQKRTGSLDLDGTENQVTIYFKAGKMVDIFWRNRPDSKKLANTLIKNKLLTEKEAYLALGHQKKSIKRLGTILFTMGFVSKKDIVKALSVHTIEAIMGIASMVQGSFAFSPSTMAEVNQGISNEGEFEELYAEFLDSGNDFKYINQSINEAIKPTETPNLFFLAAGPSPPNPSELLGSRRMEFLIECLKKKFDFIILDTSPVIPATDALLLTPNTDGALLVIKAGHADRKIIKNAITQFEAANLPIIGTILNQVNMKKEGYYKYYGKYYTAYYGKKD